MVYYLWSWHSEYWYVDPLRTPYGPPMDPFTIRRPEVGLAHVEGSFEGSLVLLAEWVRYWGRVGAVLPRGVVVAVVVVVVVV
jgi:hypothetical protein